MVSQHNRITCLKLAFKGGEPPKHETEVCPFRGMNWGQTTNKPTGIIGTCNQKGLVRVFKFLGSFGKIFQFWEALPKKRISVNF